MDQTPARNTRPFLKAMGLALPVIIVTMVWAITTEEDPTTAGELAGELAVAPFLGGIAVGLWARLAPRRWHWPDYILRFVLCTVGFFGLNAIGRSVRGAVTPAGPVFIALTEAEKEGLHLGGGWIRHSKFDFTLPVGDKVDPAPQIQDEMNRQLGAVPGVFAWAFEHQTDGVILVYVAKGPGDERGTFGAFARGLGKGTGQHAAAVLEDEVRWGGNAGDREFRYAARLTNGEYTKVRCVPGPSNRNPPYVNPPYVVCVQTLSPDSTGLDEARSYLKVHTATIH